MARTKKKRGVRFQSQIEQSRKIIRGMTGAKDITVRTNLPQAQKISNGLSAILHSEVPQGAPLEAYQAALSYIVLAWNLSLLLPEERLTALEQCAPFIADLDDVARSEFVMQVEKLIAKKLKMFPDDKRYVITWDVQFTGGCCRVTAGGLTM